ncbi:hypothetical protein [Methylobacterium brachiatum]|uniref:hypothetical protein n=1 Tax=Methylobacterium brachiatum TaxID=269660 RepID=UPI00244742F8|nr:hypothetical protein [Methylobacterium brachiatum]MDH2313128.1 hypothetical protein [Methylobacterium brachiatum]
MASLMCRFAVRLAVLLGLRTAPVPAREPKAVHRGEIELFAGPAHLGAATTPIAKLSAEEAHRCFGVTQGR